MPILLLDPNPDSRQPLAEILRMHGYKVMEAASAQEALLRDDTARLLVVDVGFSDVEILGRLGHLGRVPAVALGTSPRLRPAAIRQGFAEYMLKPLSAGELMRVVDRLAGPYAGS